ncbi:MAG: hypothetical protein Athens071426_564 [Parcubacteria group bacterium Athens0714_26]|nr:MAG: hypothetical protein Athens071426_564 [Parcubacteria group bacterium Athens0714_26]
MKRSSKLFSAKKFSIFLKNGFTLVELLITVTLIGILSLFVTFSIINSGESAKVSKTGFEQRGMTKAIGFYLQDMGFFPPDVNRGWDPGFAQPLPWNPDTIGGNPPPSPYNVPGTNCSHCPADWQDIVAKRWNGPYISNWPSFTAWKGKYDYNYWGAGATRGSCILPPGVYVGVQGDYNNNNAIPLSAEQKMIDKGFDAEQCLNGESQMLLWTL